MSHNLLILDVQVHFVGNLNTVPWTQDIGYSLSTMIGLWIRVPYLQLFIGLSIVFFPIFFFLRIALNLTTFLIQDDSWVAAKL